MSDYNSIQDGEMRALLKKYMMEQDEDNIITQNLIEMEAKIAFGLTPVAALVIPGEKEMLAKLSKGAIGKTSLMTWLVGISLTAATGLGIYTLSSKATSTESEIPATPVKEKNTLTNENKQLIVSNNGNNYTENGLDDKSDTVIVDAEDKVLSNNLNESNSPYYMPLTQEKDKTERVTVACMSEEKNGKDKFEGVLIDDITNFYSPTEDDKDKKKNKKDKKDKKNVIAPPAPPAPPLPPDAPAPPAPPADVKKGKNKLKDGEAKLESHAITDSSFTGIKKIDVNAGICDLKIIRSGDENTRVKSDILVESKGKVKNSPRYKIMCQKSGEILKVWIENEEKNQAEVDGMLNINGTITMEVPAVTDAIISNQSGNVDITGIDGKNCKINVTYGDVHLTELGHEIDLTSTSGDVTLVSCKGKATLNCNYGDISVSGHVNSLKVDATSGDIAVTSLTGDNNTTCDIKNAYGSLNVKSVKASMKMKVQSGDVTVEDCEGKLEIISGYGEQKIRNLKGNLNVVSTSGDVHVNGLTGDIRIQSSYGNVVTNDCVGDISINAVSGDIKGKNIKVNTGIDLNATYGNIKMQLANGMDDLSFDLLANMGDVKVRKAGQVIIGEEGKLHIQKGKINIKALTTSGSQLFE
ncbi:MAG TPA: DUF4097 family beta strand repeat-containing protein [Flavobacteriales bacterium]|nr:DUF4097 family beta strand repeat-containing protein [Flavobacteriales bacterium]